MTDILVSKLPPYVRIGPFDFKIDHSEEATRVLEANRNYGECSSHELVIRISSRFASSLKLADSFIHECNHGIWYVANIRHRPDDEEAVCALFATYNIALYRDNPWLLPWLQECLSFAESLNLFPNIYDAPGVKIDTPIKIRRIKK